MNGQGDHTVRLFKPSVLLFVLAFILVLSACGNNGSNSSSGASPSASESPSAAPSSPSASESAAPSGDETRKIEHAMGTTEVKGVPQRIVVLEWTYGEDLLALGVQPVGFADIENYKKNVNIEPQLSADVVDVGTRQEPNLEMIASLKPDLIIGVKFRVESTYEQLAGIAPTIVFDPYPAEGQGDQYQEMEQTFKTIADVVGKTAEADKVLEDLNRSYEENKAKLAEAGKADMPFVLAMAFSDQNAVTFRLSTDNALAVKALERIGLKNAYHSSQFEGYGFSTTDVEALPGIQDATLLHIIQSTDPALDLLAKNPVWSGLDFVKENRVYALGGDTWPYGGPLSVKLLAQKTTDLLTQ
ncbi:iron-siderophore ABC transporter substrate-binding protein [Cohnella algarum]|nr:iron-siderophore ABC transporter substrate-binding protein [Cohnella algarum]